MWDAVFDALLAQGLPGISILVLAYVVWQLYRELRAKEAAIQALTAEFQKALQMVQDARVSDATRTIDRIVELTRSIDRSTDAMQDAVEAFKDRR